MDYDKLVKGRRRNIDALKPEELRRREKEEQREKRREEREKAGKSTKHERIEKQKKVRTEKEEQEFKKATRDSLLIAGVFLAILLAVITIERLYAYWREGSYIENIDRLSTRVSRGEEVNDLSNPVAALTTWRTAWVDGDFEKLLDTYSMEYYGRTVRDTSREAVLNRLRGGFDTGGYADQVTAASAFEYPKIVRMPTKPWSDGELAVFKSLGLNYGDDDIRYFTVSFAWSTDYNEWRFVDLRRSEFFNPKWSHENAISTLKGGPNAVRYDEEGNRIK